jgi:hypothetical protein
MCLKLSSLVVAPTIPYCRKHPVSFTLILFVLCFLRMRDIIRPVEEGPSARILLSVKLFSQQWRCEMCGAVMMIRSISAETGRCAYQQGR